MFQNVYCRFISLLVLRLLVARSLVSCVDIQESSADNTETETIIHKCLQRADKGPCDGEYTRWYYSCDKRICTEFIYGGCEENENNYHSKEDCEYDCFKAPCPKDISGSSGLSGGESSGIILLPGLTGIGFYPIVGVHHVSEPDKLATSRGSGNLKSLSKPKSESHHESLHATGSIHRSDSQRSTGSQHSLESHHSTGSSGSSHRSSHSSGSSHSSRSHHSSGLHHG